MTIQTSKKVSFQETELAARDLSINLGKSFVNALTVQDFEGLKNLFQTTVRFRAVTPSKAIHEKTNIKAMAWFQDWFGDCDTLQIMQSTVESAFDWLYLAYRLRIHSPEDGWQVIEQHAYCAVQNEQIADMWLLCSGFRREPEGDKAVDETSHQTFQLLLGGDFFYDAGNKGCAEGPLDEINTIMNRLQQGQTLEIHATDPSVARDLPPWCRLRGHELVKQEANHYLIRHS
jgi:TusA-related sulfurtransferase